MASDDVWFVGRDERWTLVVFSRETWQNREQNSTGLWLVVCLVQLDQRSRPSAFDFPFGADATWCPARHQVTVFCDVTLQGLYILNELMYDDFQVIINKIPQLFWWASEWAIDRWIKREMYNFIWRLPRTAGLSMLSTYLLLIIILFLFIRMHLLFIM